MLLRRGRGGGYVYQSRRARVNVYYYMILSPEDRAYKEGMISSEFLPEI